MSHFAFIASIVPAALCTVVLLAAYGGSPEGRVLLFGTSGLLGWTQSPGLVLVQVVTSVLGGECREKGGKVAKPCGGGVIGQVQRRLSHWRPLC